MTRRPRPEHTARDTPAWAHELGIEVDGDGVPAFEARRAKVGERPFGLELTLIRKHNAFAEAAAIFWGFTSERRAFEDKRSIEQRDALRRALDSCKTLRRQRGVAEVHYEMAAGLMYSPEHKGHRAHGPAVFFGHQHERDADGKLIRRLNKRGKVDRVYLSKERQQGLARKLGVCVRTIYNWWRVLLDHGVWKSWRPKRDAAGVIVTKDGQQVYSQRTLVGGVPRVVSRRLPPDQRQQLTPPQRGTIAFGDVRPLRTEQRIHLDAAADFRERIPY